MAHANCAHCGTKITDHSTMEGVGGKTYCCKNCATMASAGTSSAGSDRPRCAHCEMPIVDESTMATRGGQTFCCNNCATAMTEGATHRT
jgi:hypothetical protein